jgi:hypothetical protein
MPQEVDQDQPHLGKSQLAPNAIAGTNAKGLRGLPPIVDELTFPFPTLGNELVRTVEVGGGATGGKLLDSDRGL